MVSWCSPALYPSVDISDVTANVGWSLRCRSRLHQVEPPSERELYLLREVLDPQRDISQGMILALSSARRLLGVTSSCPKEALYTVPAMAGHAISWRVISGHSDDEQRTQTITARSLNRTPPHPISLIESTND